MDANGTAWEDRPGGFAQCGSVKMLVLLLSASYNKREEADMEKGKRILLVLLFVILAAMGIMAGTFLAGGGLKPRPGVDRGERETAQAYPEPSEGQTARAEAGQEIKGRRKRGIFRRGRASGRYLDVGRGRDLYGG